jgi:hypothetical protein
MWLRELIDYVDFERYLQRMARMTIADGGATACVPMLHVALHRAVARTTMAKIEALHDALGTVTNPVSMPALP